MCIITQYTVGDPSVLHLVERDRPEPGYGQVLIKAGAIGVNPVDVVLDLVGGEYGEWSACIIKPGGVLASGFPRNTGV